MLDDEWNTPVGEAAACGGDALVRVEAFERVGGFRPWLMAGEEPELCLRLREDGWKIWRLNEEMTQHDAAMHTFAQWWIRSVRSGYGFAEVSRLYRASPHVTWRREIARAIFWAGVLPLVIVAGALDPSVRALAHVGISSSGSSARDPPRRHLLRELVVRNPVCSCKIRPATGNIEILLAQLAPTRRLS